MKNNITVIKGKSLQGTKDTLTARMRPAETSAYVSKHTFINFKVAIMSTKNLNRPSGQTGGISSHTEPISHYLKFGLQLLFVLLLSMTLMNVALAGANGGGNFETGTSHLFIVDDSRPFDGLRELFVGTGSSFCKAASPDCLSVNDVIEGKLVGKRTLAGQIFYPVDSEATNDATPARHCDLWYGRDISSSNCSTSSAEYDSYLEVFAFSFFGPSLFCDVSEPGNPEKCNLKPNVVDGKTQAQVDALIDDALKERYNRVTGAFLYDISSAPVSPHKAPYPLVILAHGDTGGGFELGELGRRLAKSGYITVIFDYAGNTVATQVGKAPNFSMDNPGVLLEPADVYRGGVDVFAHVFAGQLTEYMLDCIFSPMAITHSR